MPAAQLAWTLEHRSGLLGLTGSADMKSVVASAAAGDHDAALGLDVYVHRLRAGVAGMAAAMNGLDALVFTGGVGERADVVRARAADGLAFLGVEIGAEANRTAGADTEISAAGAAVRSWVIAAREDLEIAREVATVPL